MRSSFNNISSLARAAVIHWRGAWSVFDRISISLPQIQSTFLQFLHSNLFAVDNQISPLTCWNSMDGITEKSRAVTKNLSPCDIEALRKCLQENNGDRVKCESQIQAFKSSCSLKKPNPSLQSERNNFETGV